MLRQLTIFILCTALILVSILPIYKTSAAEDISPWLSSGSPAIKNLISDIPPEQIPTTLSDGNQDCFDNQKVITRAKKAPSLLLPSGQSEISYADCVVHTKYGFLDRQARITRLGTKIGGQVYSADTLKNLAPIPNSDTAMEFSSAPTGVYLKLQHNISARLSTNVNFSDGTIKHDLQDGPNFLVRDELSKPLPSNAGNMSYSGNGGWAVFEAPYIGMTRLNTATGEILLFAPSFANNSNLSPNLQTAVSSDGRYAVVHSSVFPMLKIYDLSTCISSGTPNTPASCQYKDYRQFLLDSMANHQGVATQIRFTDNYSIKFYGRTKSDGVMTRYLQLLTASGQNPQEFPYLALGDSFASGEGARDYRPGTDVIKPLNKCHLSVNSYPYLLGERLNLNRYESIACSGAKIKDVNGQYLDDYREDDPQAKGKSDHSFDKTILTNFEPGYRMQKQFVGKYTPNTTTISISGNDVGFGAIVRNCVFWVDDCYSKPIERAELAKKVNDRFDELVKMYGEIKATPQGTTVYALGYPQITSEDGKCRPNVRASQEELRFINAFVTYLNSVIEKAAKKSGVYYVDVTSAFAGHKLCEDTSQALAVNGLTAGNDKLFDIGPIGNESYHPNALGHKLYADKVLNKTNDFSAKNPYPDTTIKAPELKDAKDFIGINTPDFLDVSYSEQNMADNWWYKQLGQAIQVDGFAANSAVLAWLTSDPVQLGSFQTDQNGNLSSTINLPENTPIGYHTLHVAGQNLAGEKIEYQQQVFVAANENDYDGDGTANSQEKCPGIELSGVDYDKDLIDDACDPEIGEPPVNPPKIKLPTSVGPPLTEPVLPITSVIKDNNPTVNSVTIANQVATTSPQSTLGQAADSILGATSPGHGTTSSIATKQKAAVTAPPQATASKSGNIVWLALLVFVVATLLFVGRLFISRL